jgi:hypothetical protein
MRLIELSNHPDLMLQREHQEQKASEEQARRRYEDALTSQRQYVQEAREGRDRARADRRWLDWLRYAFAAWRRQQKRPLPPISSASVSGRAHALAAGITGEKAAAMEFDGVLGDDWVLFRGYKNGRGEIDQLLLGPLGCAAIEVKYRNATVHCDGDDWWFDKYDKYGNLVGQGVLEDRKGRSPSRQLNEPADELHRFLDSRGHPVRLQRVILFNHARSRIGDIRDPRTSVATSGGQILDLLEKSPTPLDADEIARITALVIRDHEHHENRRRR